ncbi:MAG: phosphatase PAP2 family protein [Nitrospirota bacterium]
MLGAIINPSRVTSIPVFFFIVLCAGFILDTQYNRDFIKSLHELEPLFKSLSFLGLGGTQALLLVAVALAASRAHFLDIDLKWRIKRAAHAGVVAVIFGGIMAQVLKHLVGRPRPRMEDIWGFAGPTFASGFNSFPSGHTVTSFALAAVMARYFPGIKWFLFIAAGFIAISRVGGGSHYPSDVAGGLVFGIIAGNLVLKLAGRYEQKDHEAEKIVIHKNNMPISYSVYFCDRTRLDILKHAMEIQNRMPPDWISKKNNRSDLTVAKQYPDYDFQQTRWSTVIRMPYSDSSVYFKVYNYKGIKKLRPLLFYPSKSFKFLNAAERLSKSGINAPGIIAYGDVKNFFFLEKSFVFLEEMKGVQISRLFRERPLRQREILRTVAIGISKLHRNGIYHSDMGPWNVFWDNGKIGFIDLDTIKMKKDNNISLIIRDLGKLNDEGLSIGLFGRLRFFVLYLNENPDLRPERKKILRRIIQYSFKVHRGWKDKVFTD